MKTGYDLKIVKYAPKTAKYQNVQKKFLISVDIIKCILFSRGTQCDQPEKLYKSDKSFFNNV